MTVFLIAMMEVAVLLACAVPGFLFVKKKMVRESCIPDISKIMLYVCQPILEVYTFTSTPFSTQKLANMGIFALIVIGMHAVMFGVGLLLFGKKGALDPFYRVMTIGTTFGNCAFFGIPIIEALLPDIAPDLIVYTTVYAAVMNILGWTVGLAILSRDTKYISVKKVFVNPAMIGLVVALILFVTELPIPTEITSMIQNIGRMATPLSMIVMGMRLATANFKDLVSRWRLYFTVAVKQLVMPLLAFAIVFFLPIALETKQALFIICACPVAANVLNFAEVAGQGQHDAADLVLLGTALSIVTLPVMMLLLPMLG